MQSSSDAPRRGDSIGAQDRTLTAGSNPEVRRYSPELPWRPVVPPQSVTEHDACAIYASVRRDATPRFEPVGVALSSLQKMLHRAGSVDGEGDGCGLLVDIPRLIWAEEVRAGGHNPALARDPAFVSDPKLKKDERFHSAIIRVNRCGRRVRASIARRYAV